MKPQLTDQFDLDPRVDSIEVTKRWIPDPIRAGYTLLGFQTLVVPHGSLTKLKIVVTPRDASGKELNIVKSVVDYRVEKTSGEPTVKRLPSTFETDEVIKPAPVGVYLLVDGTPAKVSFDVFIGENKIARSTEWSPGIQRV